MAAYEGCFARPDGLPEPDMTASSVEQCYSGALAAGKPLVLAARAANGPVHCFFKDAGYVETLESNEDCLLTEDAILGKDKTLSAYVAFPVDAPLVVIEATYGTHDVSAKVGPLFAKSQSLKISPDAFGVAGSPVNAQTFTMRYMYGANPEPLTLTGQDGDTVTLGDAQTANLIGSISHDKRYRQQLQYLSDRYALCMKLLLQAGGTDEALQGIAKQLNGQLQQLVQTIREDTTKNDAQLERLQQSLVGEIARLQGEYTILHKRTLERHALQDSVDARRQSVAQKGWWYDMLVAGTGLGAVALLALGL